MKIFTAEQIYQADKFTIEKQGITSDVLMERAATQIFNWLHARLQGSQVKIHIFCGIGNNGGDGIALARLLYESDYNIAVYVVNYSEKRSKDFLINLDRLKERKLWPEFFDGKHGLPEIQRDEIIVDAIFGIGLNRPPEAWVGHLIAHINTSQAFTLSVDLPSGLSMTSSPVNKKHVIRANHVLSFQAPKLPFFLPETGIYANQWELLDIGLDGEFLFKTETEFELIGKPEVLPLYRPRLKFSHKGSYGHVLVIGGSKGKIGAAHLASKAALRSGAGLVTAYLPECGYLVMQSSLPEVMVITDTGEACIERIRYDIQPSVIAVGMGMGTEEKTVKAFLRFLKNQKGPLVIDADGLNILATHQDHLKHLSKGTVLTPHPKELERLIGGWDSDFDKLERAKAFSKKYAIVLVLKGAHTIIIEANKGFINSSGNPGMATAGSGDVLAGMITGFIAQGYEPLEASIFAVYLHGLAGDLSISENGYEALTASTLTSFIGKAFIELFRRPEPQVETED